MAEPDVASDEDTALVASLQAGWGRRRPERYFLTRFVFLRALGFIHFVAFSILVMQWRGLIGSDGLLPATLYLERIADNTSFAEWPTLFWWNSSDLMMACTAWLGWLLAVVFMLGADNAVIVAALWVVYMSFCHVGQVFWGYGWETLLLEATFLAIFLCPLRSISPLSPRLPPPTPVIWMLRWLVFRLMFGAGLIKIRGDSCWTELTCLAFHYETQPNPHPLSWLLHQAPMWFHKAGTLFNHFVELIVPWFVFGPGLARRVAGGFIIVFQGMLILSGNLSFLNWLTIAVALACFDDDLFRHVLPRRICEPLDARGDHWLEQRGQRIIVGVLSLAVAVLSVAPITNMLSPHQAMNTSFDPLHLVNSYGAFGSIGKVRHEVVLQGTWDEVPDDSADWKDYEFKCKPGDVNRRPCLITPYHYRLDWQMWFAALSNFQRQPWLLNLIYKLLRGDSLARSLIEYDPFVSRPPRFIRAELYRYEFTRIGDGNPGWWKRTHVKGYIEPLSLKHQGFLEYLAERGWLAPEHAL